MRTSINSILFFILMISMNFPLALKATGPESAKEIVFITAWEGAKNPKRVAAAQKRNARIKEATKKYWDAGMNCKFMIEKEAYKYARKNKGTIVGEFVVKLLTNGAEGSFDIRDARTRKILSVRLPANKLDAADLAYAMIHGQFMLRNLDTFKKPTKELPKKYGHLLKKKTLLIGTSNFSKRFTQQDLKQIYPYKYKVVSDEEIAKAIIDKDENHLVLYEASEAGNVSKTNYSYWNIYQPNDGVVVTRHSGSNHGLSEADIKLFVKRTSK